jgi:DNA-binding LytR/AlgR family response regulator
MIKCIIIEDQEPAQRILKRYLADTEGLELLCVFRDALSALEFLKDATVDLIFLDIHLPKLSGMDFLSVVSPMPQVILTTAFSEYAIESYDFEVTDYLLKPFSFERFVKAVYRAKKQLEPRVKEVESSSDSDKHTLLKVGHDLVKVNFDDIQYIKADGDYTHVYTQNKRMMVGHSLKYWLELVPDKSFCQIHRSCIVNVKHVHQISGNTLRIEDASLPIGRVYKQTFINLFQGGIE